MNFTRNSRKFVNFYEFFGEIYTIFKNLIKFFVKKFRAIYFLCCLVCENALKSCENLQERRLNYEKFNHKVIWGGAFSLVVSVAAAFALSACGGGDEFSPSNDEEKKDLATIKEKYPDAKFLSYEAAKKELGSTSSRNFKECILGKGGDDIHYFAKMPNGEIKILEVYVEEPQVREKSLDSLKKQKIVCFMD